MRQRHGAVITKNGNIISAATNRLRNCPHTIKGVGEENYSYHAEQAAIRRAAALGIDLNGAVIYVAREVHGMPSNSRPCNRCYKAISEAGIKKIVYT